MVAYWERVWIMEGGSSGDLKTLFTLLGKKSRRISFSSREGLSLNNTIRLLAVDATSSSQLEAFLDNCLHCWLPQCLPLLKYQITAAINVCLPQLLVFSQWFLSAVLNKHVSILYSLFSENCINKLINFVTSKNCQVR